MISCGTPCLINYGQLQHLVIMKGVPPFEWYSLLAVVSNQPTATDGTFQYKKEG